MIRLALPKGYMSKNILELFSDCSITIKENGRSYRPYCSDPGIKIKIKKPQNIAKLVETGAYDAGITGYDWIIESQADISMILDLKLDKVKIVAAIPKDYELKPKKTIRVASEYENITRDFLTKAAYKYTFIRSYGATEAYPPEDADMIIENVATGRTLLQNNLISIRTILESSTRFIANKETMLDAAKKETINSLASMMESVLLARKKVMLEMNTDQKSIDSVLKILPAMKTPTISKLYKGTGYAIRTCADKDEVRNLIPALKKAGATDILEYSLRKIVR